MKDITSNEDISKYINLLYNQWFCKYRSKAMKIEIWDIALNEFNSIVSESNSKVVFDLGCALLDELDRRCKNDIRKNKSNS